MSSKKYMKVDATDCIEDCTVCPYNIGGLWENCEEMNNFYMEEAEEDYRFLLNENGKLTMEYLYFTFQNKLPMTLIDLD